MGEFAAWARSPEECLRHWGVDAAAGLSEEQVAERRARHGWNELTKPPSTPLWQLVLQQFDDVLVKVRVGGCRRAGTRAGQAGGRECAHAWPACEPCAAPAVGHCYLPCAWPHAVVPRPAAADPAGGGRHQLWAGVGGGQPG